MNRKERVPGTRTQGVSCGLSKRAPIANVLVGSEVSVAPLVVLNGLPHPAYRCLDIGLQSLFWTQVPAHDRLPIAEPTVKGPTRDADGKQNHDRSS